MGALVLASENLFSRAQFPNHVLGGTAGLSGFEAFHVGRGDRSPLNKWISGAGENVEATLEAAFDRVRSFDLWALDRTHNLGGERVVWEASDDDFATVDTIFDGTVPTQPGGALDGPVGALTGDGAWLKRFDLRAGLTARIRVPAAVGLTPEIGALYLCLSYEPDAWSGREWDDSSVTVRREAVTTPAAWTGYGPRANPRSGRIALNLNSRHEYERARYHLERRFARGAPTWIVFDTDEAHRAVLAEVPANERIGLSYESDWVHRQAAGGGIPWVEKQPLFGGA